MVSVRFPFAGRHRRVRAVKRTAISFRFDNDSGDAFPFGAGTTRSLPSKFTRDGEDV